MSQQPMNQRVDVLIKQDHDLVRKLHGLYKREPDQREKQKYANELIRQLAVHSHAEEIIVYPVLETRLRDGKQKADHSRMEHLKLKHELYKLDHMQSQHPDFTTQCDRVFDVFLEHVKEEEESLLPELARNAGEGELLHLGRQFNDIKRSVPTHPHPWAPDRPPLETIVGSMQAPIDKSYDYMAREFPDPQKLGAVGGGRG